MQQAVGGAIVVNVFWRTPNTAPEGRSGLTSYCQQSKEHMDTRGSHLPCPLPRGWSPLLCLPCFRATPSSRSRRWSPAWVLQQNNRNFSFSFASFQVEHFWACKEITCSSLTVTDVLEATSCQYCQCTKECRRPMGLGY